MASGEVTVTCVADEVTLRDLGLRLARGAVVPVSPALAAASADLENARRAGLVSVRGLLPVAVRTEAPADPSRVLQEALLGMGRQLLVSMGELTREVRSLRAELAQRPATEPASIDAVVARLEGAVRAFPQGTAPAPAPPSLYEAPVPMFIPDDLGVSLGESSVEVARSHSADTGTLDSTAAALREARRNKNRKRSE